MIRNCERSFLLLLILIALSSVVNAQTPTPQGTPSPQSYLPTGVVTWLYAAGALASALASVAAWYAKIRWGKELEDIYNGRITNLQQEKAGLEQNKNETIAVLEKQLEYLKTLQEETRRASDERLAKYKDQVDLMEKVQSIQLKTKEGEVDTLKAFLSPDFTKNLIEQSKQLQQIVEERREEIEILGGQVKQHPLDATDLALRKDKLELEQQILTLTQAYAMKVSSQSFSDKAVSGADEGKIQSALKFLNQLGSSEAGYSQTATEETQAEHRSNDGASRKATAKTEELTGKTK